MPFSILQPGSQMRWLELWQPLWTRKLRAISEVGAVERKEVASWTLSWSSYPSPGLLFTEKQIKPLIKPLLYFFLLNSAEPSSNENMILLRYLVKL